MPLFGRSGKLKQGRQKLTVWPGREGCGKVNSTTPGKCASSQSPMDEFEKLMKKYNTQEIPHVDWLDKFVGKSMEKVNEESAKSETISLSIVLPDFKYPVIYYQKASSNYKEINWSSNTLVTVPDPELGRGNPVEEKHLMMSRGPRSLLDQDLKPNSDEKKQLEAITSYPPIRHLLPDESELLWKFPYYIRSTQKLLTKFLKCVDWSKPSEKKDALRLMKDWAPIDVADSLDLLSFQFKDKQEVRSYAVERLKKVASDHEIMSYLLQLVQALRYDKTDDVNHLSDLAKFLIQRGVNNPKIGVQFYWYLVVERRNPIFEKILKEFKKYVQRSGDRTLFQHLKTQKEVIQMLTDMSQKLNAESGLSRKEKSELCKKWLSAGGEFAALSHFSQPIYFPMNPDYMITGIKSHVHVFQSATQPLMIVFNTTEPRNGKNEFPVIWKLGDDLRQDQLILQLIQLMDELLKKENLDLKLTPYRAMATSTKAGIVELVPNCTNVADVIEEFPQVHSIRAWLRKHQPDKDGPDGIKASTLDNFLRSCAGYCVITYILGIGDRHLDNLLMAKTGELFHIDFGFILGRDPKPWPPPMKLAPEMVEAMGDQIGKFKMYCCNAYNTLRKSSNLILNLVSLMIDAGIDHINQGDKSILKVQEKFKLDYTDEQANIVFLQLIEESREAFAPQVAEAMHRWKKYWTKDQ